MESKKSLGWLYMLLTDADRARGRSHELRSEYEEVEAMVVPVDEENIESRELVSSKPASCAPTMACRSQLMPAKDISSSSSRGGAVLAESRSESDASSRKSIKSKSSAVDDCRTDSSPLISDTKTEAFLPRISVLLSFNASDANYR